MLGIPSFLSFPIASQDDRAAFYRSWQSGLEDLKSTRDNANNEAFIDVD
jgi:hypothetical protein